MQQPQQYQGYQAQQNYAPQQRQQQVSEQTTVFYKSGLFLFASAAGRFQRSLPHMEAQGWRIHLYANLGRNILLRQIIAVTYVRSV